MTERVLRLWAPRAGTVSARVDGRPVPCERDGETWTCRVHAPAGTRYEFVVDGEPVPDPRSRSQPAGVDGPSAFVDLPPVPDAAQGWRGRDLWRAVIQEIHVGTFSRDGTFSAAAAHLHELAELGVTHVELMPLAAFAGRHGWGYDGVHLTAPHAAYGTATDLAAFVRSAHDHGLAVLVDVVHNHLGPEGNHLARTGPYFTGAHRTPWGEAVNLDGPGSDGVRSFLVDSARYWIDEIGADGLRLDAVHELIDTSARPFLEQLAAEIHALGDRLGRRVVVIAESDRNDSRLVEDPPAGPGLDAHWSDDLHHALHVALTGERQGYYADYGADDLPRALVEGYVFQGDRRSRARGMTPGRPVDGTGSEQLVVALQNHDQIGNRARGERLHHLVGTARAGAAAALTVLSPFTVLLFQGEEWAASTPFPYFTDFDGELGEAVREGRRREFAAFGWPEEDVTDPQDPATFGSARLRWDERTTGPHADVLEWYRRLLRLRREHPALEPAPLPRPHDGAEVRGGVVHVRRGGLQVVADLRAAGAVRETRVAGTLLACWGDSGHDGDLVRTAPGSAVVVEA